MLIADSLKKHYQNAKKETLSCLSMHVGPGTIYGLIGRNGAGKTTVLRILSGIIRPDSGTVTLDGEPVYENPSVKERIFFSSDTPYFFGHYSLNDCVRLYKSLYSRFDISLFRDISESFELSETMRPFRISKGMRRLAALTIALACRPDYLILDEPLDGLDTLTRKQLFKHLIAQVSDREMAIVISSHNLR